MSRFTKPSINWKEIEKLVPANQKNQFIAFKGKSDGYFRRVTANPPEPPKIDWDMYSKTTPVAGLVDKFKSAYESFKVPFPEDKYTSQVEAQWKSIQGEVQSFVAERQKEIDEATKEVARIKALPKFEDMTMEDFYDLYPNQALDTVRRPSFWPHDPDEQPGPKEKKLIGEI